MINDEKLKVYEKLKQKIEKKKKEKQQAKQEKFFCPLCGNKDLPDRDSFNNHLLQEHMDRMRTDKETKPDSQSSIPSDVK